MKEFRLTLLTLEGDLPAEGEVRRQVERAVRANAEIARKAPLRITTIGAQVPSLGAALRQVRDDPHSSLILSRDYFSEHGRLGDDDRLRSVQDEMTFSLMDLHGSRFLERPGLSRSFLIKTATFVAVGSYIAEGDLRGIWIRRVKGMRDGDIERFLDTVRVRYFYVLLEAAADQFMPEPP